VIGLTQDAFGQLRLLAAEGESLPGPVLRIGNSNHRIRFGLDLPEFMSAWTALGPTHHVALGLGHRIGDIAKVARLLDLPLDTVG
jgi:L-arabinose isomerase